MLDEFIDLILPSIIAIIELIGIFVVSVSAVQGFYYYLRGLFGYRGHNIKLDLANGMATGLEFKVAAEILKTVLVRDLNELLVLGSVIVLRALLALLIHFEMKSSKEHDA
ncbi:MAG TPA: hypothetical protein DF364_01455 [Ruminococcaceae bacterium]|nr:hypothetical protein [Oscillospiraceae bacterium]